MWSLFKSKMLGVSQQEEFKKYIILNNNGHPSDMTCTKS